jgi:pimeloyl-ACP methyl ester carboxylesterase
VNVKSVFFLLLPLAMLGHAQIPALWGSHEPSTKNWEEKRRAEVLEVMTREMFGRAPTEKPNAVTFKALGPDKTVYDGQAILKKILISYESPSGKASFPVTAVIPISKTTVPVFLEMSINYPDRVDENLGRASAAWPAQLIVKRGYAAVVFDYTNAVPDNPPGFKTWTADVWGKTGERVPDAGGSIAGWAWCISRVIDWMETEPTLDAKKIAVVGFSRGGKTALWAGATDKRIAMTVACGSGGGGAKLMRMNLPKSEPVARLNKSFPHWFCPNYALYGPDETQAPFDMHWLTALIAPRLLYVSSATLDLWAGPEGEFQSCVLASPIWEAYGKKGLTGISFPAPEQPLHDGEIGYHLRSGVHFLTEYDWVQYINFADKHLR